MKNLIFFLLLFSINGLAQDSTNKNSGIITRTTLGSFKMDGKGVSENTLKKELYKVPAAIPLYKKALTHRIIE